MMAPMTWQDISGPLLGGTLIGLAAGGLLALTGKTAGVSGIVEGAIRGEKGEWRWKAAFLLGLVAGGVFLRFAMPQVLATAAPRALPLVLGGAFLAGFGARLGGGCTSGHGVCGIARLSGRGLVGTLVFMAAGAVTVLLLRKIS